VRVTTATYKEKVICLTDNRPVFPKRAIITAGMPYGNKELHFGHIGGVFVHADFFARFLRDRIGKENVIFVSGTDCYGSPISENYRKLCEDGEFSGSIEDFITQNHEKQKKALDDYLIDINLFAASGLGRAADIHAEMSEEVIKGLHDNGFLTKITTSQFYDPEFNVLLNGRQVTGQCPIEGCQSDRGYADECSLGHQYMPSDLLNPKSTLSGKKPEMREVANWYFNLEDFLPKLQEWVDKLEQDDNIRPLLTQTLREFLRPPVIYIKKDQMEFDRLMSVIDGVKAKGFSFETEIPENKPSLTLSFNSLKEREGAAGVLSAAGVRFRTGKTLVPFRITGDTEWGVSAPVIDGLENQTFWVWPESLWAPISFTKTYLEQTGKDFESYTDWWCDSDCEIYQFIGQDNIYFYGLAEPAMFMALQGKSPSSKTKNGQLKMPVPVANNHILFLDKKASSSGKVKPPMAAELLDYYTPEQLRAHFLGLGLGIKSVSFRPKPFNPNAPESEADPALKEGNVLTNVFNRVARSCFYTIQQYCDGQIPVGEVGADVLKEAGETILAYEMYAYKHEFYAIMNLLDVYIRNINKQWSRRMKEAEADPSLREQILIDSFHMLRVAAVLTHPVAPLGTELTCEYFGIKDKTAFFSWDNIFKTVYDFMDDPKTHKPLFLEPKFDFFEKHSSQLFI